MSTAESVRVLHVDDEPDFAELAAEFLERESDRIDVVTETDPRAVLDRLESEEIDCVIADYDMPRMDGLALLEAVRERDEELPFVLFTGKGSEAVASEALSAGATDYLQKGHGTEQYALLANRVLNYVDTTRSELQRERQLEAIETAREGISILDEEGELIYVNRAFADLYGYEPEELLGEHWELLYPADEAAFVREEVLPRVREEGDWRGTTTGLRADGTTFVEDHTLSTTDGGGLVCTIRDATDREKRQRELRRYETVVEAAGDPMYVLDADCRFEFVNDAFVGMTGYDREEIVGEHASALVGEDSVEVAQMLIRTLRDNTDVTRGVFECDVHTDYGSPRRCEVNLALLPAEEGFRGTVGIIRDITERKERERELERYETIMEAVPVGVFLLDEEGRITETNERAVSMIGHDEEELLDEPFQTLVDQGVVPREAVEEYERKVKDLLSDETDTDTATLETEIYPRGADERRTVRMYFRILPYEEEFRGTAGVYQDVTEHRDRERELERKNARLEEFTSTLSHDLRNPLTVLQGRIDVVRDEYGGDESFDAMERAATRMEQLISDLLALARHGRELDETEEVSLETVASAAAANVELDGIDVDVADRHAVAGDPDRLQELFENLFRNTVEHGETATRIRVGELEGEEGFYVADDGVGLPDGEDTQVFERGYSTADRGTGMGLSIVERIAEAHGWSVGTATSEADGARFEFLTSERPPLT